MTPLYKITLPSSNASSIGLAHAELHAKMEMFNPTGTHKDRSLAPWILHYKNNGEKELVISSSGNSALSAAKYSKECGLKLYIFLSASVDPKKLEKIKKYKNTFLNISKTPKSDAIKFSKNMRLVNLRSSLDDKALEGYKAITHELSQQLPRADNIFVPTSSGTTLEGMYLGYKEKGVKPPSFYVVQTARVHPIASCFDKNFSKERVSYADAIVDNIAHRKNIVTDVVKETKGGGYVVSNNELEEARKILANVTFSESDPASTRSDHRELDVGWQSILSFAGFLKYVRGKPAEASTKISVCLFTD